MDDIIKIIEPLEKSGLLIDGATETENHEIKKQKGGVLSALIAPMAASLIASLTSSLMKLEASSLLNVITGKGIRRAGKG